MVDPGCAKGAVSGDLEAELFKLGFRRGTHPYVYEVDIPTGEGRTAAIRVEFISGEGGELSGRRDACERVSRLCRLLGLPER